MKNRKCTEQAPEANIEAGAEFAPGTSSPKERCGSGDNAQQGRCSGKNNKKKK